MKSTLAELRSKGLRAEKALFLLGKRRVNMPKIDQKKKEPAKPLDKISYEDTAKFKLWDRLMRKNKGVRLE